MSKKNYAPRLAEIAGQMGQDVVGIGRGLGDYVSEHIPKPIKKISYWVYQKGIKEMGGNLLGISTIPYILPSTLVPLARIDSIPEIKQTHAEENGCVLGLGSLMLQTAFYADQCHKGNAEWLLLPLATNVINGMWEWGKYAKERVASNHKKQRRLEASI